MTPTSETSRLIRHGLIVGSLVFVLVCVGIAARQFEAVATFWPANAVLLGVLLRWPQLARWQIVLMALVAQIAARLVSGQDPSVVPWFAIASICGVVAGMVVWGHLSRHSDDARPARTIPTLFVVSAVSAFVAGMIRAPFAATTLDMDWLQRLGFLFANEFTNHILILPLLLLFPVPSIMRNNMRMRLQQDAVPDLAPPVVALLLSLLASAVVGGPGAIAFPVPALIWCAVMFSPWVISSLNFLVGIFFLVVSATGWLGLGTTDTDSWEITSLRFGVALLTLGPLTLSEIERDRRYAMINLKELATQDSLTAVMNRRAFDHAATEILDRTRRVGKPVTMFMLDVDHFKQYNDTHGHLAGDLVLTRLANIMTMTLPDSAVVGRVGGEEFAAVVPFLDQCEAYELGNSLRVRVEKESGRDFRLSNSGTTVSVGIAWEVPGKETSFIDLMKEADQALYEAKSIGRNQVVLAASANGESPSGTTASAHI